MVECWVRRVWVRLMIVTVNWQRKVAAHSKSGWSVTRSVALSSWITTLYSVCHLRPAWNACMDVCMHDCMNEWMEGWMNNFYLNRILLKAKKLNCEVVHSSVVEHPIRNPRVWSSNSPSSGLRFFLCHAREVQKCCYIVFVVSLKLSTVWQLHFLSRLCLSSLSRTVKTTQSDSRIVF